jgi:predicted metallo-beta-lactamase superfamily hydrolase
LRIEIIGAESLGVRSLCCLVTTPARRVLIDPGLALGYVRHGLLPHPIQIALGRTLRKRIIHALNHADDVVVSHFHGDHIPLVDANPYQLSMHDLQHRYQSVRCWSKSADDSSPDMRKRWGDLVTWFGDAIRAAEGCTHGPLAFSHAVPHGTPNSALGSVMMTRIESGAQVFVHASDIQLLDETTVDSLIDWRPTTVLAGGPPLYLGRLGVAERERAWQNALRLAEHVKVVILDHHVLRDSSGEAWLKALSETTGKRIYCAADFMGRPRQLLESRRQELYDDMPVPPGWHGRYARGAATIEGYFGDMGDRAQCAKRARTDDRQTD